MSNPLTSPSGIPPRTVIPRMPDGSPVPRHKTDELRTKAELERLPPVQDDVTTDDREIVGGIKRDESLYVEVRDGELDQRERRARGEELQAFKPVPLAIDDDADALVAHDEDNGIYDAAAELRELRALQTQANRPVEQGGPFTSVLSQDEDGTVLDNGEPATIDHGPEQLHQPTAKVDDQFKGLFAPSVVDKPKPAAKKAPAKKAAPKPIVSGLNAS